MKDLNAKIHTGFLPNFCSARVLFVVLFSAELLAIVLSLDTVTHPHQLLYDLAMHSFFIQWIALSCVALLCVSRRHLDRLPIKKSVVSSYLLILLVAFIITEFAWWATYVYPGGPTINLSTHKLFLLRSLSITAIVGGIVLRYLYLQHEWRANIEIVAASQLQALQSRIRPHFLFNCMNTIASLTRKSPAQAEEAVECLAELFRACLLEPANLYPIKEEWQLCRLYLHMERHRLGERLKIDWDVETIPNDALIPPLCLQPLLENSIYHGIERLVNGGVIEINGKLLGKQLVISVINPLPEDNTGAIHQGNKHAQENIRQRLLNIFGEYSGLEIKHEPHLYTVILRLPYRAYEDPDR